MWLDGIFMADVFYAKWTALFDAQNVTAWAMHKQTGRLISRSSLDLIPLQHNILPGSDILRIDRLAADRIRAMLDRHPRTPTGGFWHRDPTYENQMWLDGIFMADVFYAKWTRLSACAGVGPASPGCDPLQAGTSPPLGARTSIRIRCGWMGFSWRTYFTRNGRRCSMRRMSLPGRILFLIRRVPVPEPACRRARVSVQHRPDAIRCKPVLLLDGIFMADVFYAKWTALFDAQNVTAWEDIVLQWDRLSACAGVGPASP
jgi:hypothetical protein